ncbi:tetratricopeptide repeat protein [Roseibium sp. M-1]
MLLVDDRLKAAKDHAAAGRHDNAALLFESVLDVSPGHPEALSGLIETRLAHGDFEAAQTLLSRATALSQQDAGFLTLAARVSLIGDKAEEAERLVDRARALDPLHVQAALLKAEFLAATGALAEVEDLLNAVRAQNETQEILTGIARLYLAHGMFSPALSAAQDAHALAPGNAAVNALVGQVLTALQDHGKAAPYLEAAHLQDPANADYMLSLANNAAANGQLSEAVRVAKRAKTLFPDLLPVWLSYVRIKTECGEADEALREFAPVAKTAKNRMEAVFALATAYGLAGETEKSLQLLEPLCQETARLSEQDQTRLFGLLQEAYLSTGQLEKLPEIQWPQIAASLDLPEDVSITPDELTDRLKTAALVIEPGLSNLEFMLLARFLGASGRGLQTPVAGPAALSQLARLFGYDTYLPTDMSGEMPPAPEITCALPVSRLLGLPASIRGGLTGPVPYLPVREDLATRWRNALAEFPRPWVGLSWNEAPPGLTLATLLPALPPMQGTLVSTIWDQSRQQLSGHKGIIDAGLHVGHLEDLAALLHVLDFVIGPDGLVLHAAGAAGTPGLALVPHVAPWYWHAAEKRSLWYPSLDVVRAPHSGHWATLLPDMAGEISERLGARLEVL